MEYLVVDFIKSVAVDIERLKGVAGYGEVDLARAFDLGEVAHAPQQGIGYSGGATASHRYLGGSLLSARHPHKGCRALHDTPQHGVVVVLEVAFDAESRAQRRGKQAAACGCPHERERAQGELHAARPRPFVYHNVDAVILHSRVEVLLHHGAKAVYLVDKKHIVLLKRGKYACKVARLVEHGTRRYLEAHAEFVGHDSGKRGLAQPRRAEEQYMVERLGSHARRLHEHPEVVDNLFLAVETLKTPGTERFLEISLGSCRGGLGANVEIVVSHLWSVLFYYKSYRDVWPKGTANRPGSKVCRQTPNTGGNSAAAVWQNHRSAASP